MSEVFVVGKHHECISLSVCFSFLQVLLHQQVKFSIKITFENSKLLIH